MQNTLHQRWTAPSYLFLQNEVVVRIGDAGDVASWAELGAKSNVIVNAVADQGNRELDGILADALLALKAQHPALKVVFTGE